MPLPPIYSDNLNVVFIGTEPGKISLETGHYYANPRNSFYKDLYSANFIPKIIKPTEDQTLPNFYIGLDDVYDDPEALKKRLEQFKPSSICFNSKDALLRFLGVDSTKRLKDWAGKKAGALLTLPWSPLIWALYDSSGIAIKYHNLRLALLLELREIIRETFIY